MSKPEYLYEDQIVGVGARHYWSYEVQGEIKHSDDASAS